MDMTFGLSEDTIRELRTVFARFGEIREVWLFGSRAKGNYHAGSDIDLAVKSEEMPASRLLDIQVALDDLDLLYQIDVVDYGRIKEPAFRDHIDRVGVLFYACDEDQISKEKK